MTGSGGRIDGRTVSLPVEPGGVPERLNGAVSKTVVRLTAYRGFESHPLRCFRLDRPSRPGGSIGRQFGAVVVTNYLWRALLPTLVASVAPGGVLLYETFAAGNETVGKPSRPDFLLQPGELLTACVGLRLVAFEDGFLDDPARFVQRVAAVREISGSTVRYRVA